MDNLWAINDKFVWLHAVVKAACCHSWNYSLWLIKQKQVVELTLLMSPCFTESYTQTIKKWSKWSRSK